MLSINLANPSNLSLTSSSIAPNYFLTILYKSPNYLAMFVDFYFYYVSSVDSFVSVVFILEIDLLRGGAVGRGGFSRWCREVSWGDEWAGWGWGLEGAAGFLSRISNGLLMRACFCLLHLAHSIHYYLHAAKTKKGFIFLVQHISRGIFFLILKWSFFHPYHTHQQQWMMRFHNG